MSDRAAAPGFVRPLESGRLLAILVVDIALPWLAIILLERRGVALLSAIAAAALFPLASILFSWLKRRRIEFIGLAVMATMLSGIGLAMASGDVRFSLVKAAPAFGLFGAACLASLFAERPLVFHVARHFSTGGDPAKAAQWDQRLAIPAFRRAMRVLTIVWGVALLLEAAAGIAVAILVVPEAALVVERVLGFGTLAGLFAWTTLFARRRQAQGQAMQAAAAPAMAPPAVSARDFAAPALPRPAPAGDTADEFHQSWYPVALSSEIASDTLAGQDFLGSRIIIYRDSPG